MNVNEAIGERRAYRSFVPVTIPDITVRDLALCAGLAASCFNNQPWRFVFVRDPAALQKLHEALSKGNEWARSASMIVAVCSKKESDCDLHGREYFLFDTGMATAQLILRATELGLVAHPIAGYREDLAKAALGVPDDLKLITLIIVGTWSRTPAPGLSEKQLEAERERPPRLAFEAFAFLDRFASGA